MNSEENTKFASFAGLFKDKVILITGGTGFLGRNLVSAILPFSPASIRLFSRDETKHHKISEEFGDPAELRSLVGDVRDFQRLKKAMHGVDYVIHAAAMKRLDLIEYNVEESIKTNILGTLNVVNACLETGVKKAVFISTDKACSPVNTYGACKFVGERIFTESNFSKGSSETVFTCVRYGNVLESTGSVIPLFLRKIKNKQEIPLTHPEMTRFIITPQQAVELVLKAIRYSIGGEIFVPRLPAFKIIDLISVLQEKMLSNCKTGVIGLRPGEKIHEQMLNESEIPMSYCFEDMLIITSCIAEYIGAGLQPEYINEKNRLNHNKMKIYSSENEVKNKSELAKILIQAGII
jgi:FlaA1/EpsC-like NDP-sugar epimerase